MKLVRIYLRVLGALHREARLAWILAIANLALAAAQFAEPVLFGRVIDTLTGASGSDAEVWPRLMITVKPVGRFWAFRHHLRHAGGALCRPAGAPATPLHAQRLF